MSDKQDKQIEKWLKSDPQRTLPPEAEQRIAAAVSAAQSRSTPHWWSAGIPLWQAAAACVAVFLITLMALQPAPKDAAPPLQAEDRPATLAKTPTAPLSPYAVDISKWKILSIQTRRNEQ